MIVKPLEKPQNGSERFSRIGGRREPGNTSYICSAANEARRGIKARPAATAERSLSTCADTWGCVSFVVDV